MSLLDAHEPQVGMQEAEKEEEQEAEQAEQDKGPERKRQKPMSRMLLRQVSSCSSDAHREGQISDIRPKIPLVVAQLPGQTSDRLPKIPPAVAQLSLADASTDQPVFWYAAGTSAGHRLLHGSREEGKAFDDGSGFLSFKFSDGSTWTSDEPRLGHDEDNDDDDGDGMPMTRKPAGKVMAKKPATAWKNHHSQVYHQAKKQYQAMCLEKGTAADPAKLKKYVTTATAKAKAEWGV